MKKIFLLFFFFTGITFVDAASIVRAQEEQIPVDLTKLTVFYTEVYLNSEYKLNPEIEKVTMEKLNRVVFIVKPYEERENYKLISSVPKKNKYNSSLNYDLTNFQLEEFNPLKYNFQFYENYNQFFRIDNTDYLLMIKSAK